MKPRRRYRRPEVHVWGAPDQPMRDDEQWCDDDRKAGVFVIYHAEPLNPDRDLWFCSRCGESTESGGRA